MVSENQTPHSLHFRIFFWSNSLSHLLFLSFKKCNIHPAAIIFLSFTFLHPTAWLGRRFMLQLRPNGEVLHVHAAASGRPSTAPFGECQNMNHLFRFFYFCLPLFCIWRTEVMQLSALYSLLKLMRDNFWEFLKSSFSMYFLPSNFLLGNIERVYHCTCYCI